MAKRILLLLLTILIVWIAWDFAAPRKSDLQQFDPVAVGQLDAAMWKSYYERKPAKLFFQLARLMREQYRAPFWRSYYMAYTAARAAFVFKDGQGREDYAEALPPLRNYFRAINRLSDQPFEVDRVAELELEWWIIRREPDQYSYRDWERLLAEVVGQVYHLPAGRFADYAQQRTEAMLLRDRLGQAIRPQDWQMIEEKLVACWTALHHTANVTEEVEWSTER